MIGSAKQGFASIQGAEFRFISLVTTLQQSQE